MYWRRDGRNLWSECGRWGIVYACRGVCVLHERHPDGHCTIYGRDFPSLRDAAREAQRRAG